MDLKNVVATVRDRAEEADRAFHAGHSENSHVFLLKIVDTIDKYFKEMKTEVGDVTKSATSEKPEETSKEKPEQAAGAQVPKKGVVPFAASQKSALDQAGP